MLNGSKLRLMALLVAVLGAGWYLGRGPGEAAASGAGRAVEQRQPGAPIPTALDGSNDTASQDPARLAFEQRSSGRVIAVSGTVERTLADDRDGSPHQRFIIRTPSDLSVLVAHNLELAPRLEGLAAGDRVSLLGQYEWNEKGGVLHWTHADPAGRHATGYIEWHGRRYQ